MFTVQNSSTMWFEINILLRITVYLLMFFRPVAGLIFNPMVSIAIVINLPESNRSVVIIHVRLGLANCTDYI